LQKGAAPKKETARITLPPEGGAAKPALPKATIKMGQTQPLASRPQAATAGAAPATAAPLMQARPASDGAVNLLSGLALVASLAVLAAVYLVYAALGS
jgi:hypothetical protein